MSDTNNGQFKKGFEPWNKGKIGVQASTRKGMKLAVLSDETKKKMSLSHMGRICTEETRLKIGSANRGKIKTLESRNKISLSKKGKPSPKKGMKFPEKSGEMHPNWIKDRSKVKLDKERGGPLHKQWSKSVKNRDNWKCKISNHDCEGKVVAHHILGWSSYPELRYEINNGITLCHAHHPLKRAEEKLMIPLFRGLLGLSIGN